MVGGGGKKARGGGGALDWAGADWGACGLG